MTIITHAQYMANSEELHQAYYLQFATENTKRLVLRSIGADKIKASNDPYFNDIPLHQWDALDKGVRATINTKAKRESDNYTKPSGYLWSLSDTVCTAKACAREYKEQAK